MEFYKLSGKKTVSGLLVGSILGVLGTAVLSLLYAALTFYIPIIYILFFITLGYGVSLGVTIAYGLQCGRVRDAKIAKTISICGGLLGAYLSWLFWMGFYEMDYTGYFQLTANPILLLKKILELGTIGVWTVGDFMPTGWMLYAVWIVEAVGITWLTLEGASMQYKCAAFCENCQKWVRAGYKDIQELEGLDERVREKLLAGDLSVLKKLKAYENTQPEGEAPSLKTILTPKQCKGCHALCILDIEEVVSRKNGAGKIESDRKDVLINVLISETLFKELSALQKEREEVKK